MSKENFSIAGEYKKAAKYLKGSLNFIYFAGIVFFIFAIAGFVFPVPELLKEKIIEMIQEILSQTEGLSTPELVSYIFVNNLQSSFASLFFGIFFGIVPFISSIFNGYVLGFVASFTISTDGFLSMWKILPHGIFELPAIFISFGLGLKFATFILKDKKAETFREYLWNSVRVFLLVVLPLLVAAAIIEGVLISISG